MNHVTLIPFVGYPHFSILVNRVQYLNILFMSRIKYVIIFLDEFKIGNSWYASINSCYILLFCSFFLETQSSSTCKRFLKTKIWYKTVEDEQTYIFIYDVKQLNMSSIINYIWQLVISTSNAILEVSSLRLCCYSLSLLICVFRPWYENQKICDQNIVSFVFYASKDQLIFCF